MAKCFFVWVFIQNPYHHHPTVQTQYQFTDALKSVRRKRVETERPAEAWRWDTHGNVWLPNEHEQEEFNALYAFLPPSPQLFEHTVASGKLPKMLPVVFESYHCRGVLYVHYVHCTHHTTHHSTGPTLEWDTCTQSSTEVSTTLSSSTSREPRMTSTFSCALVTAPVCERNTPFPPARK